jgi:hypothetical protein
VEAADGSRLRAWTYIFRARFAHRLGPGDWEFDRFLRAGKARFISQYVGFGTLHTE